MQHTLSFRLPVSKAGRSFTYLTALVTAAITALALVTISIGPVHAASFTSHSGKLSVAKQSGIATNVDYRDNKRRYGRLFRHHRRAYPYNQKQLYPYKYKYHTPPRRYRYACAYDRWGKNHPLYRQHCAERGGLYYVPKSFYRKNRFYRGRPYMRKHYRNMRGRWR